MERKEVFISYHGGRNDDSRSSYKKAEELYDFLENRGIKCFLFKKENNEDFYDAIDRGLKECNHFILVACDKNMLSEWVRDEVKQFDGLRKNGQKPANCLISAYIFGTITKEDLFDFNTLFTTKDIQCGDTGFEKIYNSLISKGVKGSDIVNKKSNMDYSVSDLDSISKNFLGSKLKKYSSFTEEEYLKHCYLITKRLKCMSSVAISLSSENVVEDMYKRIMQSDSNYLYRVSGRAGTQKSYVLQMLYVCLRRNYGMHDFEPIYLNCDVIRDELENKNTTGEKYLEALFYNTAISEERIPLFIIDGVLNIVADNSRLDYALKKLIDKYDDAKLILGINLVYSDNEYRLNTSPLIRTQYNNFANILDLTLISLYDKEKCIEYISTIDNLPINNPEQLYEILNKSGLLSIDETIIRIICENYYGTKIPKIMDVFENRMLDYFDGSMEDVRCGAELIFEFAYDATPFDYSNEIAAKMLKIVCRDAIYLNYLIAVKYFIELEKYERTKNLDFFKIIFPKEITRFITSRLGTSSKFEGIVLDLATHYNEMSAMGKSEMSFFLGRIKNPNYRKDAIDLLNKYYDETKLLITQKIIDDKYNGIHYSKEDYKQDLFLLRGLSVSLIYCDNRTVLQEYLISLIDNDLSNSINRGFHLEYYGDKRYMPTQNMLDYEDNVAKGERTLRILCNAVDGQINSGETHPAFLLELFTIVSLLQVRIETNRKGISFNIIPYIKRCRELVSASLDKLQIDNNIIECFFKMAMNDFDAYLESKSLSYAPYNALCNEYLPAKDVKRTGWVTQGIDDPESIVEHMYACWFIGLVFLPNENHKVPGYNKQLILDMLLVHDLAETKLTDIPKYEKVNYPGYDEKENEEMLNILLKGTYNSVDSMTSFVEAWDKWYERKDENSKIAKDIDTIQAIYQFLVYNNKTPEKFSEERRLNWLNEVKTVKTATGKDILRKLVCENDMFKEVLKNYSSIIEQI